ncbi:MAG: TetR/AcrR family transcriptional regulator [Acidobacteriaceae bacterium]|nr:TetR/AcrR family transcriptional regulator [Acidobacteriaceae bacterium]
MNKHEVKTKETRTLLIKAAEKIFVRDGYEGAELGEIATLAGRTKGAIYAHFKSKEDIFLALVDEQAKRVRSEMSKLLAGSTSQEENLSVFRKFYMKQTEDQTWAMLLLEFKLFAIRHPDLKEQLQKRYDEIYPINPEKTYTELLGSVGKGRDVVSRSVAVHIIIPLLSAIALEATFSPTYIGIRTQKKVAELIFDTLLPQPNNK